MSLIARLEDELTVAFVADPEGHLIEVVQLLSA